MAGGGSRPSSGAQSKKKRRTEKDEEDDVEESSDTETGKKGAQVRKANKKAVKKDQTRDTSTASSDNKASGAPGASKEALQTLKEKFNELHRLRFTEPEQECAELRKLMAERKSTSDEFVQLLEGRVKELEGNAQALIQSRKREKEALDELAKSRDEVDRIRKSLEMADQERAALVRALENVSDSAETSSEAQKLASILDTFKFLTGVTVKLDDNNLQRGSCTIYNPATKKGAKFDLVLSGDDVQFTPVANKQLLRPEHQSVVKIKRAAAPEFMHKVMATFF